MRTIVTISQVVKHGLDCDGIYITQPNEPAAGQDVFHLHFHIYPRWHDIPFSSQQAPASADERQATLQRLKTALLES